MTKESRDQTSSWHRTQATECYRAAGIAGGLTLFASCLSLLEAGPLAIAAILFAPFAALSLLALALRSRTNATRTAIPPKDHP